MKSSRLSSNANVLRRGLVGWLLMLVVLAACGDPTTGPVPKTPLEGLAAISGVKMVEFDQALFADVLKQFSNTTINIYVSDDDYTKLFPKAEEAVTATGYQKLDSPTVSKLITGDTLGGIYARGSTADVLMAVVAVPSDSAGLAKSLNLPGATEAQIANLARQIKGKKSAIVVYSTPGIFSAQFKGQTLLPPPNRRGNLKSKP